MVKITSFLALVIAASVLAHPGEHHSHEHLLSERAGLETHARHIQRGLNACAQHPKFLALKARGQARRAEKARLTRMKRGLASPTKRDTVQLDKYVALSHNSSDSGYTLETDPSTIFASTKNASCVLTPKITEGPYYVTGEYYRSDVVEEQSGVPLHIEYQYIDISTCDAVQGLYIEQWHANATGVYSGVEASGNGVGSADPSNLNNTFLRGIQSTDSQGVAAFDTIFPGHYSGRTVHIHMMAHQNGTIFSNGTFTGASISSVGQVFWDQTLISAVSGVEPYASNTQSLTLNTDDTIAAGEADDFDPFAEYAYLGELVSDGILAWINVGINMSASYTVSPGAYYYGTGGVEGTGMGSDPGSGSGGGSAPSGGLPTGAIPSGAIPSGSGGMGLMSTSITGSSSLASTTIASSAKSSARTSAKSSIKTSSESSVTKVSTSSSVKSSTKSPAKSSINKSSAHSSARNSAKQSTERSTKKTSKTSSVKRSTANSGKVSAKTSAAKSSVKPSAKPPVKPPVKPTGKLPVKPSARPSRRPSTS